MMHISRKQFLGAAIGLAAALYPSLSKLSSRDSESDLTTAPEELGEVPEVILDVMTRFRIPGLSCALITKSGRLWSRGFGVADTATNSPITTKTIFQAASLTKPVFAYAVLKLVQSEM